MILPDWLVPSTNGFRFDVTKTVDVVLMNAGPNTKKVVRVLEQQMNIAAKELVHKIEVLPLTVRAIDMPPRSNQTKAELEAVGAAIELFQ